MQSQTLLLSLLSQGRNTIPAANSPNAQQCAVCTKSWEPSHQDGASSRPISYLHSGHCRSCRLYFLFRVDANMECGIRTARDRSISRHAIRTGKPLFQLGKDLILKFSTSLIIRAFGFKLEKL